jgi:hypothetical protein
MNEIEFINQIDCKFPYNDRREATRLIDLAYQLSPNSAFMVADELAHPPRSKFNKYRGKLTKNNQTLLLELLTELEGKFDHPLMSKIIPICRKMIQGQSLTGNEVLEEIDFLSGYPIQSSAACIIYFSCNCEDDSCWDQIDQRYHALIESWEIKEI